MILKKILISFKQKNNKFYYVTNMLILHVLFMIKVQIYTDYMLFRTTTKSTQVHKQTNMHEGYGLVWTYHYNVAMSHLT